MDGVTTRGVAALGGIKYAVVVSENELWMAARNELYMQMKRALSIDITVSH